MIQSHLLVQPYLLMEAVKNGEIIPASCHTTAFIHAKGPDGYQLRTSTTVMAK